MATISHGGLSDQLVAGRTLFDHADGLQVRVPTSCGRAGTCHECVVAVDTGMEALSARTEPEAFLRDPFRLACQATVTTANSDVAFSVLRRAPGILTSSPESSLELAPAVTRRGDSVCLDGAEIDRYRGHVYGLAIDVGTTTVALDLVDLESGRSVRVNAFGNPQLFAGSDVMSRISFDGGRFNGELQTAIVSSVNSAVRQLARECGFSRREIYEVTVAGNSTMRDLFFGIDVQGLGQRPYRSRIEEQYQSGAVTSTALASLPAAVGLLIHPRGRVYGLPLIGSHVGGDAAADLAAAGFATGDGFAMLVDVGTNTEVIAARDGRVVAASCPAGPAFEGGLVGYGMPAYEGAIESLEWDGERFRYQTIGNGEPQGICGSGLIDLLAELRKHGRITEKGVFTEGRRVREIPVVPEYGISFSREDASNLAQAKAANYCGQVLVARALGSTPQDLDRLYLAGGFANYVNVASAVQIGLLAELPEQRIVKVGNAALAGARQMLLSSPKRSSLETLVASIEHVELETASDFFEVFVEGCRLEPMSAGRQFRGART